VTVEPFLKLYSNLPGHGDDVANGHGKKLFREKGARRAALKMQTR
jgi:hypothetical protein